MNLLDRAIEALFGDGKAELHDPADQPREDQELVSYVKNWVEEQRNDAARVAHEGIWMTNIAYILGYDNIFYDPSTRQFRPLQANNGSPTFVKRGRTRENVILPACQKRAARMTKSPPKYDVRPNSMTEDDKESARLGIEIIDGVFDRQKVLAKRQILAMWLQQCGHGYVGVSYDPDLGEPLMDPMTDEVLGKEGDIRVDIASAFECFADKRAKTWDEVKKFARCKVRSLDYFRTRYPERGKLVKEEGVWLLSAQYEQRINTMNTVGPASSGTAETARSSAIEISYYEAPSEGYENGRHIIVANGVLLENKELVVGVIPYVKFDDIIVAGKFFSETPVTHSRPLQDQYNVALQKCAEWTRRVLAGKYIAAKGHGLIQEALNDQTGEVVEYDNVPGAPPPTAMQIPVIPEYVYKERDQLKKAIWDQFNLSEVSRGQLPSASIPGIGINLLLEQDETTMGFEVEHQEHAWAQVGRLILMFTAKCVITDRKLKTKGAGLEYQVREYNGQMLRANFDVTVIRGSTVPNSKILKRQEIMNLYQTGLLGNPQDPAVVQKVLSMMEYGDVSEAWKRYHLNMTQINKTIKQLEQGIQPIVDPKDNHILHLQEKNDYRLSDKWDQLLPEIQEMFQMDMDAHTEFAVAMQNPDLGVPPPDPAEMDALRGGGPAPMPGGPMPGNGGPPMPMAQPMR